ncbi:plasmid mobilization relaxosome protein MobC [Eubacterium sp. LMAG:50]|uniref:plasmid mobilization protein n=1 Tax=Eubacterium sp. LMAG:50 TaxID=1969563 RepID=UPI0025BC1FDC|nr:plasmid mobilization relaxosome protein MobC [Eubacterium sp. LMAG:50]
MKKNNKDITKRVRLTENECRKIMKEAKKKNMNFSTYVRYVAKLDKNMDPEFIKAIYKLANEINYIGHNINQVVKNNNSKLYSEIDKARLMEYMRILNEKVESLLKQNGYKQNSSY